ncbi:RUN domain-containing protein 3A [Trichinella spiralis]|uniref:RUN domain-containing protein 3A n=1 Tax=Trichinella spiralis TaxID=6334 RepID=A0ABR3KFD2_TRISP
MHNQRKSTTQSSQLCRSSMTCRVDSSHDLSSPSFAWSKPTPAMPRPPKPHPQRTQLELKFPDNTDFHWGHLSGKFWEEVLCPVFRFIKDEAFDDDDDEGNRQGCRRETRATVPCTVGSSTRCTTGKFFHCRRERALPNDAFGSREQAREQRNRSTCCRLSVFWWNNIRSITGEEISDGLSKVMTIGRAELESIFHHNWWCLSHLLTDGDSGLQNGALVVCNVEMLLSDKRTIIPKKENFTHT